MSGISFMGVGSGLPVNEIIKATVAAESAPLVRLENDKKFYQSQISAMGQLSSRLSTMRTAMLDLRGQTKFQQLAANTGNNKLFTATADHVAGATAGKYTIEVLAEARNYRHVSGSLDKTATFTGTLTFNDADGNPLLDKDNNPISINAAGKTLDQIRSEINSHADLKGKISANLVNESETHGRLVINSAVSGEAGRFTANFSDASITKDSALSSYSQAYHDALAPAEQAAYLALHPEATRNLDARIKIDGIEASSSTNTFSNVVSGVTINVAQGAMNETSKISSLDVKRDDKAIIDNINAFVKAYNDVIIHLNEAKKGSLYGDNTIRSVEGELRNILYTPTTSALDPSDPDFENDTQKNYLALLGIEVYSSKSYDPENPDSQNGTLRINNSKLKEMLESDFDRVAHVLGASNFVDDGGIDGYAARFADLAQRLTSTTSEGGQLRKGLIEIRREGLNNEVKRINDRIDSTNMRLELLEERLVRQFSAIEGIISNLNSTGSWIGQQMSNLPGYTRNK